MAKFTLHKDKSVTLRVPYDEDFLEDFKSRIPYGQREYSNGEWIVSKKYWMIALDCFERHFPDGDFEQ